MIRTIGASRCIWPRPQSEIVVVRCDTLVTIPSSRQGFGADGFPWLKVFGTQISRLQGSMAGDVTRDGKLKFDFPIGYEMKGWESETIWALPVVKICHHQPVEKWWVLPRVWCRRMPLCHSDISLARPLLIPLILMNWQEATCFRRQHIPIHLFLHWRWFCHSLSGWMRHQRQIPPLWLFLEKASSFEKMGVPIFLL